jgi:hypothetical protein
LLQLSGLQSRFAAGAARFLKRPYALSSPSLMPSADRLPVHVKLTGQLGLSEALVKEFGSVESPLFELVKIAFNAFGVTHVQGNSWRRKK